jgi:hypothetical protein
MSIEPASPGSDETKPDRSRVYAVLAALAVGLALAPGYLILCGHTSGVKCAEYELYRGDADPNSSQSYVITVPLKKEMGRIGFNLVIATPFRNHTKSERGIFHAELSSQGSQLWATNFFLSHAAKKEAIAETTFSLRIKTFDVTEDGEYQFLIVRESGMENIRRMQLEVRRNTSIPNPWIVGLGLLIIGGVMVWALIPAKGHDPAAERTGTKWYAD